MSKGIVAEEFIERAASSHSLLLRKLVYGVGVNDSDYITTYKSKGGKYLTCPYYKRWKGMLERCYSPKCQIKHPTYKGCSVSKDWLLFSSFKAWMEKQDWRGKYLDKDIIYLNNKIYSPASCIFISREINNLLTDCRAAKGEYPQGVSWHKVVGKYVALCCRRGKQSHLGYFLNPEQAERCYCIHKADYILTLAATQESTSQPKLQQALINHSARFKQRASELK